MNIYLTNHNNGNWQGVLNYPNINAEICVNITNPLHFLQVTLIKKSFYYFAVKYNPDVIFLTGFTRFKYD